MCLLPSFIIFWREIQNFVGFALLVTVRCAHLLPTTTEIVVTKFLAVDLLFGRKYV
jgi:hypothetical protein